MWYWLRVACATLLLKGCAFAQPFSLIDYPSQFGPMQLLHRSALVGEARYRLIVLPGSGCGSLAAIAERYFAGLKHADILILHKPHALPRFRPAPADCPLAFIEQDRHSVWQQAALHASQAWLAKQPDLPLLWLGISEGAELLPGLAQQFPQSRGLIILGNPGLDPQQTLQLLAEQHGEQAALRELLQTISQGDEAVLPYQRSLNYWRDLLQWKLQQPLLDGRWPLIQAWGEADERLPQTAYHQFRALATQRSAPYCALPVAAADHNLQSDKQDMLPKLWQLIEAWQLRGKWCDG